MLNRTLRKRVAGRIALRGGLRALTVCALSIFVGCSEETRHAPGSQDSDAANASSAVSRPNSSMRLREDFPNVLLISIDTLRADHLGAYGHPWIQSPNIDTLATDGIRFSNHINASPTTLSSHTSLMTGTYPHTHGVARNSFEVPDSAVTLAELLSDAGFATGAFLGSAALSSTVQFTQGFDEVSEDFEIFAKHSVAKSGERVHHGQRRAEQVTDSALQWIDRTLRRPLFMFVHYFDVHWAYKPPAPYDRMYRSDDSPIIGSMADIKQVRKQLATGDPDGMANAVILDQLYGGEITYTDFHIGRLLDGLRERGLFEDTLVILTSDHGETMWEHPDLFNHGVGLFDTTLRTPLMVRLPGHNPSGLVVDEVVSNIDVTPTLLDWLGIPVPAIVEGSSFASVAHTGAAPTRGPVFSEATHPFRDPYESNSAWLNQNKRQSVRTRDLKLVYEPLEDRFELFDLVVDPEEQRPLEGSDSRAAELRELLLAWRARADPPLTCTEESRELLEQLQALGYVAAAEPPKCNRQPN